MREQDEAEPAHHARRPMNAFLIFCKRHRSVVRDNYPNLENRSITKILGEWWANLDKDDKACYTGLAKQYKDAFFNANPDFKWYKLPAPPLRATAVRRDPPDPPDPETTNNNCNNKNLNDELSDDKPSVFTPGKLADEDQMGGISSLFATKTEAESNPQLPPTFPFDTADDAKSHLRFVQAVRSNEDSKQDLQNALLETTRMFEGLKENNGGPRPPLANDKVTGQDVIDQIVYDGYSKDDDYGYQKQWSDDEATTKSKRSCKGKKYQEFMAVGGFIVNKRQKKDYFDRLADEEYHASCSSEGGTAPSASAAPRAPPLSPAKPGQDSHVDNTKPAPVPADADNNINKLFKASDFDLDAKINALPSLSLEKFQQRKRDKKRKKRGLHLMPRFDEPRYMSLARDAVIGSQKRKPRKISITRLEISSLISAVELTEALDAPAPAAAAARTPPAPASPSPSTSGPPPPRAPLAPGSADLLALATLAEVASNTSKIDGAGVFF